MHEHVFVVDPEVIRNYGSDWWDETARVADAAKKLTAAKAKGIDTIVEMTVLGIGRDVSLLRAVNELVDINIIAATGLYTFDALPRLFRNEGPCEAVDIEEPMTEVFLNDIRNGIAGTGIKAGMLKCVWETPNLTPSAERVQRAISQTHVETGVPITVHTNAGSKTGVHALDLYERQGVNLSRVVVGHAGDSTDIGFLRSLLDRGATVGFDRFGLDLYGSTSQRVRTLSTLCELGYASQIILSQDAAAFTESWARPAAQAAQAALLPNWHYTYLVDTVLREAVAAGVSEANIHTMMVENPKRLLGTARA